MTKTKRSVSILGSTGSVGRNTIDLIQRDPDRFCVEALTANGNAALLAEQAIAVGARYAAVADAEQYQDLKTRLAGTGIEAASGKAAVVDAARRPAEIVMAAIVGAAGLESTVAAIERGAMVAFANKEVLVCAGTLVMALIERYGAKLLPVDSEHNAIYQVFDASQIGHIERIILTASGGPFRSWTTDQMRDVTPEQAVAHPNWSMGAKISVDSATMMNKGLEIIEAHHLFQMPSEKIEAVVHPQSVIHSLVAYEDGSVLAQLGPPDMRTPIAYALAYPERMATPSQRLDLAAIGQLTFEAPDPGRFPALRLARSALQTGGGAPTVLNAANEIAVAAFLNRGIGFLDIARTVEATLNKLGASPISSLDDVFALDQLARVTTEQIIATGARSVSMVGAGQ